jgi:hypothetical protein
MVNSRVYGKITGSILNGVSVRITGVVRTCLTRPGYDSLIILIIVVIVVCSWLVNYSTRCARHTCCPLLLLAMGSTLRSWSVPELPDLIQNPSNICDPSNRSIEGLKEPVYEGGPED